MLENFKESCALAILESKTTLLVDSFDYNVLQVYFSGDDEQNFEVLDVISGKSLPFDDKQFYFYRFIIKVSLIDIFKD